MLASFLTNSYQVAPKQHLYNADATRAEYATKSFAEGLYIKDCKTILGGTCETGRVLVKSDVEQLTGSFLGDIHSYIYLLSFI
jgi:hypothetical protein